MDDIARKFHSEYVTDRDIAFFELGIKLAALFHISMGMPIQNDPDTLKIVARGLEKSISCQPFVKSVRVSLQYPHPEQPDQFTKRHEYDYSSINGQLLVGEIELEYGAWRLLGKVKWNDDLNYPLMTVERCTKIEG
jgi:hypothetical protein